jgi:hypothetical protein
VQLDAHGMESETLPSDPSVCVSTTLLREALQMQDTLRASAAAAHDFLGCMSWDTRVRDGDKSGAAQLTQAAHADDSSDGPLEHTNDSEDFDDDLEDLEDDSDDSDDLDDSEDEGVLRSPPPPQRGTIGCAADAHAFVDKTTAEAIASAERCAVIAEDSGGTSDSAHLDLYELDMAVCRRALAILFVVSVHSEVLWCPQTRLRKLKSLLLNEVTLHSSVVIELALLAHPLRLSRKFLQRLLTKAARHCVPSTMQALLRSGRVFAADDHNEALMTAVIYGRHVEVINALLDEDGVHAYQARPFGILAAAVEYDREANACAILEHPSSRPPRAAAFITPTHQAKLHVQLLVKAIRHNESRVVACLLEHPTTLVDEDDYADALMACPITSDIPLDLLRTLLTDKRVAPWLSLDGALMNACWRGNDDDAVRVALMIEAGGILNERTVESIVSRFLCMPGRESLAAMDVLLTHPRSAYVSKNVLMILLRSRSGHACALFNTILAAPARAPLIASIDSWDLCDIYVCRSCEHAVTVDSLTALLRSPSAAFFARSTTDHSFRKQLYSVLRTACKRGHEGFVDALLATPLGLSVCSTSPRALLTKAARAGHSGIVQLLLRSAPNLKPSAKRNEALVVAARSGCEPVVRVLLDDPRVDPAKSFNRALTVAAIEFKHSDIAKLLYADARVLATAPQRYARWMKTDATKTP